MEAYMYLKIISIIFGINLTFAIGVFAGEDYKGYEISIDGKIYDLNLNEEIQVLDKSGKTTTIVLNQKNHRIEIERNISGLELAMSLEKVEKMFTIEQLTNPVISILGEFKGADKLKKIDQLVGKKFFKITKSPSGAIPDNISSINLTFKDDVLYLVALHYDKGYVKQLGWSGIKAPNLGKYGKPIEGTSIRSHKWRDSRTRLALELSGDIVNAFYSDVAIYDAVQQAELHAEEFINKTE